MAKNTPEKLTKQEAAFNQKLNTKLSRKQKAQRENNQTIWSGLGMMGLVGWAVAVPTLLGAMLGIWIDEHIPSVHSWTLTLLIVGLFLGCLNAWHWVDKEHQAIRKHDETDND